MPDLTTNEAAAYLAAHGYTVHSKKTGVLSAPAAELVKRWCIAGKLKGRKRENRWLISKRELDRLLNDRQTEETRATHGTPQATDAAPD